MDKAQFDAWHRKSTKQSTFARSQKKKAYVTALFLIGLTSDSSIHMTRFDLIILSLFIASISH